LRGLDYRARKAVCLRDEGMTLTFPDGRIVNSLPELSEWLESVENDPHTSEMGKQIAWMIANKIRARLN